MGLIRAGYRAVKAAAKGGDATTVASEAAKGLMPRKMERAGGGSVVDRVAKGVRDITDSGRSGTFTNHSSNNDPWGDAPSLPKPPAPGKSNLPKPPPPPPPSDPWA